MKGLKIGPILTVHEEHYLPNMQDAYEADNERGSHILNSLASGELHREWPTVIAMAQLIEEQRNALLKQVNEARDKIASLIKDLEQQQKKGTK